MTKRLLRRRFAIAMLAGALTGKALGAPISGTSLNENGNPCIPPAPGTGIAPDGGWESPWECSPLIYCGMLTVLLSPSALPSPGVTLLSSTSYCSYGLSPACSMDTATSGSISSIASPTLQIAASPAGNGWMQLARPVIEMEFGGTNRSETGSEANDRILLYLSPTKVLQFYRSSTNASIFYGVNGALGAFQHVPRGTGIDASVWEYHDQNGNVFSFFGFDVTSTSGKAAVRGQFWKVVNADAGTGSTTMYTGDASSVNTAITNGFYHPGGTYTSLPLLVVDSAGRTISYTHTGHTYSAVTISDGSGTVHSLAYEYYTTKALDKGDTDDLKFVTETIYLSGGATQTKTQYMRYYTLNGDSPPIDEWTLSKPGHPHQLKILVDAEGCRRWLADNPSLTIADIENAPETGTTDIKLYAAKVATYYDSDGDTDGNSATGTSVPFRKYKVWKYTSNTECSTCGSAAATDTIELDYKENTIAMVVNTTAYDGTGTSGVWDKFTWRSRTTVKNPDGSYRILYLDEYNQKLADIIANSDPAATSGSPPVPTAKFWVTRYERDSIGRVIRVISPEAVTAYTPSDGTMTVNATAGLVNHTEYDTTIPGTAVSKTLHSAGYSGTVTKYIDTTTTYLTSGSGWYQDLGSGPDVEIAKPLPVSMKVYKTETSSAGTAGTDFDETTIAYTFYSSGWLIKSVARTQPKVDTSHNGSGTGSFDSITHTYLRQDGRTVFSGTADNRYSFFEYDATTGQVTRRVADVNSSDSAASTANTTTYSFGLTLSGSGISNSTAYTYDAEGRSDTTTLPSGRVMANWYSHLLDGRFATVSVPRVASSVYYGPVGYSVTNHAGMTEASGVIALGSDANFGDRLLGRPTGVDFCDDSDNHAGTIASWIDTSKSDPIEAVSTSYGHLKKLTTTEYIKNGTKPVRTDVYYSIGTNLAGSSSDESTTVYDSMGRAIRRVDATGTISRTVFDAIGRPYSQWVGTDDTGRPQSPLSGTDNMTEVSRQYFDGATGTTLVVGNHRMTRRATDEDGDWSGTTADQRVTDLEYDYRGRRILQKTFLNTPTSPYSVTWVPPLSVSKYDNRGRQIASATYDDPTGLSASTDPTTTASIGSTTYRLSFNETLYDERGQVWETVQHEVYQTGSKGTTTGNDLVTLNWRDPNGRLIKTISPSGLSKMTYDRLDRVTRRYSLASTNDTLYTHADNVTGDKVLDETVTNYEDTTGNVLWSMNLARLPSDPTNTGVLDSSGQPDATLARAQVTAMWYDALDRPVVTGQYGTVTSGNGSTFTRSGTAPTPNAGTTTVLVTKTAYNKDGTVFQVEDPMTLKTRYAYDQAGRKILTISNYDGDASTGNSGVPTGTTDPKNNYVRTVYSNGLMSKLWVDLDGDNAFDLTISTDHDQVTEYVYAATKGTLSVSSSSAVSQLASNRLLSKVIYPPQSSSTTTSPTAGETVIYAYNALAEQVLQKDQNGTILHNTFDGVGKRTAQIADAYGTDIDPWVRRMEYAYTNRGQVEKVTQFDATSAGNEVNGIKYEYDNWGNTAAFKQDFDSAVASSGGNEKAVSWTYALATPTGGRSNVRRTQEDLPDGAQVKYGFGTANGFNDVAGRVETVNIHLSSDLLVASYGYLGGSQMVTQNLDAAGVGLTNTVASGSPSSFSGMLDRYNRVLTNSWGHVTGTTAQQFNVSYDNDSNITIVEDPILDDSNGSGLVHSFSTGFTMDGRNRVTRADRGVLSGGSITGTERVNQLWTLSQTGDWTNFKNDLDGNGTISSGTNEVDDTRTFSDANEILSRSAPSATLGSDKAGELTDEGHSFKFVYDAWGRLRKVTDRAGTPATVAEYRYNALGQRIGWHYDANGSTAVDSSDPWYWFIYDDRWRIVNTYRVTTGGTIDTYPKERFVHHAAGRDGRGGSSYVDSMILADRDLDTTWSAAADATAEHRYFYLQNWRADTCAITNENGVIVRSFRYSAYGTRTEIDAGDFNRDGSPADFTDYLDWADAYSNNDPKADVNHDGVYDTYDYLDFVDAQSHDGEDQLGGRIRNLYAGYENDPALEKSTSASASGSVMPVYESWYHVRNRVYSTDLGRWTRRDPLGYHDGMGLEEYCKSMPEIRRDAYGLCGRTAASGCTSQLSDSADHQFPFGDFDDYLGLCANDPWVQAAVQYMVSSCQSSRYCTNGYNIVWGKEPPDVLGDTDCRNCTITISKPAWDGGPNYVQDICETLAHELVHAGDNCVFNLCNSTTAATGPSPIDSCLNLAATEARANKLTCCELFSRGLVGSVGSCMASQKCTYDEDFKFSQKCPQWSDIWDQAAGQIECSTYFIPPIKRNWHPPVKM